MDDQEKAWRSEFERLGEKQVHDEIIPGGTIYSDERKRQAAFRWLWEEDRKRSGLRKENTSRRARWFYVAIGAAAVTLISVIAIAGYTKVWRGIEAPRGSSAN
jgi:hypothetical protein